MPDGKIMVLLKLLLPFLVNGGFDLSENTQMYYNAAYVYKSKLIC
jgi:hypothetical protein